MTWPPHSSVSTTHSLSAHRADKRWSCMCTDLAGHVSSPCLTSPRSTLSPLHQILNLIFNLLLLLLQAYCDMYKQSLSLLAGSTPRHITNQQPAWHILPQLLPQLTRQYNPNHHSDELLEITPTPTDVCLSQPSAMATPHSAIDCISGVLKLPRWFGAVTYNHTLLDREYGTMLLVRNGYT